MQGNVYPLAWPGNRPPRAMSSIEALENSGTMAALAAKMSSQETFGLNQAGVIFGDAEEASEVLASAWFTKKAPSKLASSKRRWFELNKNEMRYYAKVDDIKGASDQKGSIGIFNATTARAKHHMLYVKNPDREWVLIADDTLQGQNQAKTWADKINGLASDPGGDGAGAAQSTQPSVSGATATIGGDVYDSDEAGYDVAADDDDDDADDDAGDGAGNDDEFNGFG